MPGFFVERICELRGEEFCGPGKSAATVMAKEVLILVGREAGGSMKKPCRASPHLRDGPDESTLPWHHTRSPILST